MRKTRTLPLRIYAHRGANRLYPENTVPAFQCALELGVTDLEMDVHRTRDGKIVVAHDATGERMAGVSRAICECDYDEIRRWDVATNFVDTNDERSMAGRGIHIPLLEDVLQSFPRTRLNIDIKHHESIVVEEVLALIRRHEATERVLVSSFNTKIVGLIRRLGYEGPQGVSRTGLILLMFWPRLLLPRFFVRGQALQLPRKYHRYELDGESFIRKAHAYGIRLDYWVINTEESALELFDLGADGIMTDEPDKMVPVVKRYAEEKGRAIDFF